MHDRIGVALRVIPAARRLAEDALESHRAVARELRALERVLEATTHRDRLGSTPDGGFEPNGRAGSDDPRGPDGTNGVDADPAGFAGREPLAQTLAAHIDLTHDELLLLEERARRLLLRVRAVREVAAAEEPSAAAPFARTTPSPVLLRSPEAAPAVDGPPAARRAPTAAGGDPWTPLPGPRWIEHAQVARPPAGSAGGSPSTPPPRARVDRATRTELTRRALLLAAADRFTARGFYGTSVSEILAACADGRGGRTKGALYFHFPSKHHLAVGLVEEADASWRAVLSEIDAAGHDPLWTLLLTYDAAALTSWADVLARAQRRLRTEDESFTLPEGRERMLDRARRLLGDAQTRSLLHPMVDPVLLARLIHRTFIGHQEMEDDFGAFWERMSGSWQVILPTVVTESWLLEWRSSTWTDRPVPRIEDHVRPG